MLHEKLCTKCGQAAASVKLTKLTKGQMEVQWLCSDCAAEESPYQKKISALSVQAILAGLLNQNATEAAAKPVRPSIEATCSACGLPFETYRSTLLLGCSQCYEDFEEYLITDLRKFHGSTVHRGRVPEGTPRPIELHRSPQELKRRLREAVEAEDFELAARLRDELRRLQTSEGGSN